MISFFEPKDSAETVQKKADGVNSEIEGTIKGMGPVSGGATAQIEFTAAGNSLAQAAVSNQI